MIDLKYLQHLLRTSRNTVFFGGAGVSTESGIPDFRGSGGLYQAPNDENEYTPEELLHYECFLSHPALFYAYYRKHMLYPNARPNAAHKALAELERQGRLSAVITQNIDGLHQAAGSECVLELHGSVLCNTCFECGSRYGLQAITSTKGIPRCEDCGGIIRPNIVLYGEGLDEEILEASIKAIRNAEVLLVGGTSLTVNPAASLLRYYRGDHLIIMNRTPTPYDPYAEMILREPIGQIFSVLMQDL